MKPEKPAPPADDIATLTSVVERDFADLAGDLADLRGDVTEIRSVMVSKTDHHTQRQEMLDGFQALRAELRDLRERLDQLQDGVGMMKGYAKELDALSDRTTAIEKHLGLDRKIAA